MILVPNATGKGFREALPSFLAPFIEAGYTLARFPELDPNDESSSGTADP